jgi:hypothetical protein
MFPVATKRQDLKPGLNVDSSATLIPLKLARVTLFFKQ